MKSCAFSMCILILLSVSSREQTTRSKKSDPVDSTFSIKKESRFSMNLHGQYSLALGSTFAFYPDDITNIRVQGVNNTTTSKTTSYQAPTKGLGEGLRVGGGVSYILNDFINLGLDIDYFESTIQKVKDSSSQQQYTSGNPSQTYYDARNTISYAAALLTFTPNITFKAISRPKWFIYNKVGAVIVIRPNSIEHDITDLKTQSVWMGYTKDSSAHSDLKYNWGIRNPSVGFMGGIGIQVKVQEHIRVYSELQFSHVVFQIRNRIVTGYNVDGKDMASSLPMSEREVVFKNDFETTGLTPNPNQPGEEATQRLPITYVGLQAGIVYRF